MAEENSQQEQQQEQEKQTQQQEQKTEVKFTQEDLNKLLQDRLATEKTKAFTKDDLLIGTLNGELSLPGKVYHFPLQIPQKQFEYNEFVKEINFNENNLLGSISEVISSSK